LVLALADEVVGAIVSVDFIGGTVTLDNGQTFLLTETVDPVMLELGQQVTISYGPTPEGLSAVTEIADYLTRTAHAMGMKGAITCRGSIGTPLKFLH
jgi:hypothetical protein